MESEKKGIIYVVRCFELFETSFRTCEGRVESTAREMLRITYNSNSTWQVIRSFYCNSSAHCMPAPLAVC
jgi:hypothetical protein